MLFILECESKESQLNYKLLIVINKNDLDPSKEEMIRKEIKEEFKEQRIFSISAITGKGLKNLVSEIGTKVFSLD